MRIALVVHDFDPGLGQGRYAIEIARRLVPRHTFDVYANSFAVAAPQPGWNFVRVPAVRSLALTSVFSFLVSSQALLRRRPHDLIHAQGLTCWSADVITAHVCNAARQQVAPADRFRSRLFPWLVIPCERRFYQQRRARHLIAISRKVAAEIRQQYGWRQPVTVIPHGTDAAHFRPPTSLDEKRAWRRSLGAPEDGVLWLFIGEAVKGLGQVIEQLPHVAGARLLVITRSELAPYRAQAARLGVAARMVFRGPERDVAPAYRAADLFVYPSRYDTFGMVVAEAMASGLPVVVGRDVGVAELIEPGQNGLAVDLDAPGELRAALKRCTESRDWAAELGQRARSTILARSWDACAEAVAEVYEHAASGLSGRLPLPRSVAAP